MPAEMIAGREMEYRVVWKRQHEGRKNKIFATVRGASRRINIMTSDEPWKFYYPPVDPDAFVCCAGGFDQMCGCGGVTYRDESEHTRNRLSPLEFARIEEREVKEWAAIGTPEGGP